MVVTMSVLYFEMPIFCVNQCQTTWRQCQRKAIIEGFRMVVYLASLTRYSRKRTWKLDALSLATKLNVPVNTYCT